MRKLLFISIFFVFLASLNAQNKMFVHLTDETQEFVITDSDSIYFTDDDSLIDFRISGIVYEFTFSEIDSITFEASTENTVYINYEGNTASVINPLAALGVEIAVEGADVIVSSAITLADINYVLSGSTENGMFKIYSEEDYNLLLNGVNITNPLGPAINIQSGKKTLVNLVPGTTNELTDGADYAGPVIGSDGEDEDQKATFFSEGELIFIGSGGLTINGNGSGQHALCSDNYVQINEGSITITSSEKDAIHSKEGFFMTGGIVNILSSKKDGIDGDEGEIEISGGEIFIQSTEDDVKGMKCSENLAISGGTITISVEGGQSKGIDSDMDIIISGGTIHIETTGGVVLEASGSGYDPSYCSAIKGNGNINISNATINIITEGEAGKGISGDGNVNIENANITIESSGDGAKYLNADGVYDAYHGSCFSVDGDLFFYSGNITVSNSGSGGKGISVDGEFVVGNGTGNPYLNVTTTGESITITQGGGGQDGDYDESKAVKCDDAITINTGDIIISSADDGIKSNVSITINGGNVSVNQSYEGLEAPFITINDGNVSIYASDDAINATFGFGGEGDDGSLFSATGGYIFLSTTGGDALDSNGDIAISGGTLVVHGPQSAPEVGMDVNGSCIVSGGFMVISGTNSNMTEGPSNNSTQNSILAKTTTSIPANTIFHIQDSNGNDIVTFAPYRKYYSIIFSSSALTSGETYSIYTGGTSTGTEVNGLYTGGTYSGGTFKKSFTISSSVANVSF